MGQMPGYLAVFRGPHQLTHYKLPEHLPLFGDWPLMRAGPGNPLDSVPQTPTPDEVLAEILRNGTVRDHYFVD